MPEIKSRSSKIGIVKNVLTTALKLWLRAQISSVSQLEVEIKASDRQILSGCIPWVSIFASHAVYQGLHLTKIRLVAENIRINIGSVLKGQPLRLLETVPVVAELSQEEEDLNASLSSAFLSTGLEEVLVKLLPEHSQKSKSFTWQKIKLDHGKATLSALEAFENDFTPLEITLGLELKSATELLLELIQVKSNTVAQDGNNAPHSFDLGSDVDIQELTLIPKKVECRGRINVNP
jgi:hypothetical protein